MNTVVESIPENTVTKKSSTTFPFLDLKAQFAEIREEVSSAVRAVLESQHFILGPEVLAFEQEVARYVGTKFAIACASGSDALALALMALGIGPGDEVITSPFTFFASAGSIARVGAKPVFADIDHDTFNISPQEVEKAITPRTRAIMPVHLFGMTADMESIQQIANTMGIPIVEDAAQAIGATCNGRVAGTMSVVGCFSFFPSKNLGGAGDGGMLTTNDETLAGALRMLRVHGSRNKYEYDLLGINSRLDALQAAILRVKLKHLDVWTAARKRNAERYRKLLGDCSMESWVQVPMVPPLRNHVYNQFTIRSKHRDGLRKHVQNFGVPTEVYYPKPLHLQKAFSYLGYRPGDFPVSERASREAISLPIYPELTEEQQRSVVGAIADFIVPK